LQFLTIYFLLGLILASVWFFSIGRERAKESPRSGETVTPKRAVQIFFVAVVFLWPLAVVALTTALLWFLYDVVFNPDELS